MNRRHDATDRINGRFEDGRHHLPSPEATIRPLLLGR
jgi:hypothetical protein